MYESYLRKTIIRKCGRYIAYTLSLLCITNIIIISIQFKYVNIIWQSKGMWRHFANLSILACFFQFLGISLAIIINLRNLECKTLQKIFCIYQILDIIYVLFVCIFSIICADIKEDIETKNCYKDLKGFFSHFLILDEYFQKIDSTLCSNDCQCVISDSNFYKILYYEGISNIYFNKETNDKNIIRFQQCNQSIQENINKYFTENSNVKDNFKDIKIDKFYKYWKNVEEKFKCIGWCNLYYEDSNNKNRTMKKYLFSDINNGIVDNSCMIQLTHWISKWIKIFGIILFVSWFLMVLSYIFGFMLCFDYVYEGPNVRIDTINDNSIEKGEIKPNYQVGVIKGIEIQDNNNSNNNRNYKNSKDNNTITNIKSNITSSNIKEKDNNSILNDSNKNTENRKLNYFNSKDVKEKINKKN